MRRLVHALFLLAVVTAQCSAGELIKDSTLGFEIELPDGWTKLSSQEYYENLGRLKFDDPKFQDFLKKHANLPVVIAAKYPEPYDDLNPSLRINARPYGALPTRDAVAILEIVYSGFKRLYTDLEIVSPPSKTQVAKRQAGHFRIRYSLATDAGLFPVESELWIIPATNFFYMVGIGYRQDGKTGTRDEAVSSIERMKISTP